MTLNKIHENIKNMILWEYHDSYLLFSNTPLNSRIRKNVSRTLESRDDTSPKDRALYFFIIKIMEII